MTGVASACQGVGVTDSEPLETDYLVVGSGAVGMAFVDSLVVESDARVLVVDRHHAPGGHWNDAYPFVRLHQPSAYYGVSSRALGGDGRDTDPLNLGFTERASAAELLAYYEQVMADLVATGRVAYHPMSEHARGDDGVHTVTSLVSGAVTSVRVRRRVVDTTYLNTAVPATHPPRYEVAEGATCIPVNDLATLGRFGLPPAAYVVVGAGKTGIDACLWLLERGVDPDVITWVVPRDSWMLNRRFVQPGEEFFLDTIGAFATQLEAITEAASVPDLFARLERSGQLLRLDPGVEPTMYHAAVVSEAELEVLRGIRRVVRMGRVTRVEPTRMVLEHGEVETSPGTVHVDCSASAVDRRPPVPVFDGEVITPQFVRPFQPTFSAAMIAWVEAHYDDDAVKNEICGVVPLPDEPLTWLTMQAVGMLNQARWSSERELGRWIVGSRLDGFGAATRGVDPDDVERVAVVTRLRAAGRAAGERLPELLRSGP